MGCEQDNKQGYEEGVQISGAKWGIWNALWESVAAEVDVKVRANNKSQTTSQRNLTNRLGTPHLSQIPEENHFLNTGVF